MVINIQWDTTLPMAYIRSGQHLLKHFHLHEDKKKKLFAKAQEANRKDVERALECFKQDSQLCMDLQDFSIVKHSKTS